jgi:UDP-N-acetylglucosamine--N-acetylmuramyl-(pentapeptide) pyrophosphoryl-undecaprenol N-acetylglucosamine transferase
MDDHQTANAHEMAVEGGARAIPQSEFTPERLASEVMSLAGDPEALIASAVHAKKCGRPMATEDLADLVESLGRTPVMDAIGDNQRGKVQAVPNLAAGAATRILALQGRILI